MWLLFVCVEDRKVSNVEDVVFTFFSGRALWRALDLFKKVSRRWCFWRVGLPIPQEPAGVILFRAWGLCVQMESGGRGWQSRTCV